MFPFSRLRQFTAEHNSILPLSGMILFWAIFDGILIYAAPIIFSRAGLSNTELGLVLGSSSLFGAAFDILISRFVRNPDYRKLYLAFFIACALVPLILWQAKTVPFFILVMLLWGIYFDFLNFGNLDFVSRFAHEKGRTLFFSIISFSKSAGYILAPMLAGLAIASLVDSTLFILMWVFLAIAFLFFVAFSAISRKDVTPVKHGYEQKGLVSEIRTWWRVGKILWSPLLFTTLFCLYDAFFYTLGPLLAESYHEIQPYNGLIVAAYWVPTFLVSLSAAGIAERWGKKRTAFIGLIFGAVPLLLFAPATSPWLVMLLIFISAIFSSLCIPAINAAYADYISEAREYEEDIEGVGDFMTNMGYVIGPAMAGIISDKIGYTGSFTVLGIVLIISVGLLLKLTPKHINIRRIYRR